MKTKNLTRNLLFLACLSHTQTKTIHFETVLFANIKVKAKKENKLIFIYAFTSWCSACKWMAKNVFTNDFIIDYFNSKFINARIDMESSEGIEIASLYKVNCYPNFLFIDGDGNLIHRSTGILNVKNFMQLAEDAQNSEKRFSKYINEYESRKNDPEFLYEYLYVISRTFLPFKEIVTDYFKTQKDKDLSNKNNWNVIRDFTSDYKSREFNYLLNNVETFNRLYTTGAVVAKIKYVLINKGFSIIYKSGFKDEDYKSYKVEILKFNLSAIDEVLFYLDMAYYEKKEDWKKHSDLAIKKGDKYYNNIVSLNNISWNIYKHSDDIAALKKAVQWMQKVLTDKEGKQWYAYDTYASLLYKLKKKQGAKSAALKAIELAKVSGIAEDKYQPAIALLEKIEKIK